MNWDQHMRDYRCKLIEDQAFVGLDMRKDSAALFEIGFARLPKVITPFLQKLRAFCPTLRLSLVPYWD
jgi:hypothetical protein